MIGTKLGNWILDKEIGRGGMGTVFLAHEELPASSEVRTAAVKILAPELAQEKGFLHRFQREIDILKQLNHPHIVQLYDFGVQDGRYYYAMEYVPGHDFDELLRERRLIPWNEVLDIALQLVPALKHAHDHGIIHRDIKPQNLLRSDQGIVKLTDFGVAKVFAGKQLTATGGLVGTAEYLSPEQAAGKPVTHRSDLYSLGVVLYLLLTGRPPFQGRSVLDLMHKHRFGQFDPPRRFVPDIPLDLDAIVCSLLEKDPGDRPATGLVLQRRLETLQRKLARREQFTVLPAHERTHAEGAVDDPEPEQIPGPGTLMSRLMREELHGPPRSPLTRFLNHPLVLAPLFLLTIGVMVWGIWFRPSPALDVAAPNESSQRSEAERLFRLGDRRNVAGDRAAAEEIWRDLVRAFQSVESEQSWVQKANEALQTPPPRAWETVHAALANARRLNQQGSRAEAEQIWDGLERLYRKDPAAADVLKQIEQDRQVGSK